MFYSYDSRLIVVHIPRTGGSSLSGLLKRAGVVRDHGASRKLGIHVCATRIRDHVGLDAWGECHKIVLVRNPFSRLVSIWAYARQGRDRLRAGLRQNYLTIADIDREIDLARSLAFEPWLDWCEKTQFNIFKTAGVPLTRQSQASWVMQDGELLVDRFYRIEESEIWLPALARRLGLPLSMRWQNRTEHYPWRETHTLRTRAFVERHLAEDLEAFSYSWDSRPEAW